MLMEIMRVMDDKGLPVRLYELSTDLGEEDQQRSLRALQARGLIVAGTRGPLSRLSNKREWRGEHVIWIAPLPETI